MKYRRFRAADGKFLDALLTVEGEFNVSAEQHRLDHEAGYGVAPLAVITEDADPWDGVSALIAAPPRTPEPPPPMDAVSASEAGALPSHPISSIQAAVTILAKADADITQAELKTLVLLMARFLLKKLLSGWR